MMGQVKQQLIDSDKTESLIPDPDYEWQEKLKEDPDFEKWLKQLDECPF